jgi:hypothetical protein
MINIKRTGQYYRPVAQPAVGRVEPVHHSVTVTLKKRRRPTEWVQEQRELVALDARIEMIYRSVCE